MRLLLVEDDLMLGEALQEALTARHYSVDWAKNAESALRVLQASGIEIIVLDIGLPDRDGISLLKQLRHQQVNIPVLLLTARDSSQDKVMGLDAGADDYLLKPFDLEELFARLRALSRRAAGRASTEIHYGELVIDPESFSVNLEGAAIALSRREFMLLLKLIQNTGRILSREQLEQSLYGWGEDVESNTIEVHIHHLRKKIPLDLIHTVRGVGYTIHKIDKLNPSH